MLLRYKGQEAVERRYSHLKGPLAVAPLFLKNNRRIAALITVISLALLIFCLIEREARRNLTPQTKVDGLYNRQPARPTGAAHPGRPGHRAPDPRDRHHAGTNHQGPRLFRPSCSSSSAWTRPACHDDLINWPCANYGASLARKRRLAERARGDVW